MKKFFLCLGMISFSFLICACNNKDNDIVVEELEKPSGIINESEEENIETTNGFKNVKSFENVFKKEYHTTPTKYRKVNN